MSKSQSEDQVRLTVRAADSMTEIFLVDSRFQLVISGVGLLESTVAPGIYKARFRSGQSQLDRFVEVAAGADIVFDGPAVEFATPVPAPQTTTWRKEHEDAARVLSQTVNFKAGDGSSIFLFFRGLTEESSRPWLGVSLHDIFGKQLAEPSQGTCDERNGFFSLNIEVVPGTYRLRVEEEEGEAYEMFIVTMAGWQTQVFAMSDDSWLPGVHAYRAALPTASVLMAEKEKGFAPSCPSVRQTELLRLGLLSNRKILTETAVNNLLVEQPLNPMLAIFAAHLLLRQDIVANYPLVEKMRDQLSEALAAHPDIQVFLLRQESGQSKRLPIFSIPPMLYSSWQFIAQAIVQGKHPVPQDSLSEQITDGVLNTSPWLIHRLTGLVK